MHINQGCWIDCKGYRIWIDRGDKMTYPERLKEANEIVKTGWMKNNDWISEAIRK